MDPILSVVVQNMRSRGICTSFCCVIIFLSIFDVLKLTTARCESGEVDMYQYPDSPFPANKTIEFKKPFTATPSVMYGITMIDINYAENKRAKIELLGSNETAFTVWMGTMHDTKLYGLGMRWMACD
ncbi:uncharacterized protein LOC133173884 [Saccostrea echinata]|uniref:uncharacterized protein LOC133173884 n=1 Tax=Saccostrea echinata TaxID=191078 RepID=UPI002A808DE7|nr:uncharacterized protein LOC133173884 [Saccostrea echinata]